MSKHVALFLCFDIYMGQVQISTFFFPQFYTHSKARYIKLSTKLHTLSTEEKDFIHTSPWLNHHYILNSTDLYTSYTQNVHKYRCSLLTSLVLFAKKRIDSLHMRESILPNSSRIMSFLGFRSSPVSFYALFRT